MCSKRATPAGIVACLSVITLVLSVCMILLAVRFNGSGLSDDLGSLGEYVTYVFYALLAAAIISLTCSCCGFIVCSIRNRCLACCFGVSLLPAAILILGTGIAITSVVNMPEKEMEKFCEKDYSFETTTTTEEYQKKLRETIY